ncbi:MAG: sulfatase [Bacteroidota bacterium]|nr:sulfatase [Bacteroidota bacterium]
MPHSIRYLLKIYFTGVVFFLCLRLLLIAISLNLALRPSQHLWELGEALIIGWRFDTVISSYALCVPFVFLSLAELFGHLSTKLIKIFHCYIVLVYTLCFFICCADMPFFRYYTERLNGLIFAYQDGAPLMLKTIMGDWRYYLYLIAFLIVVVLFVRKVRKFRSTLIESAQATRNASSKIKSGAFILAAAVILFIGMRGRISALSPMRTGTAYFCDYTYANKIALNPVFSFMEGGINYFDAGRKSLHYTDDAAAVGAVQKMLKVPGDGEFGSPICREIKFDSSERKMNVVLVIMESMAAGNMKHFGNTQNLTPFLDSLASIGYLFQNFYSAGTHTQNGIYSTLTGYPCLPNQHSLIRPTTERYECLPVILSHNGYTTAFFTSHDAQLDNMEGFCRANGFSEIYSSSNYPSSANINSWGVPDHYLFDYALNKLDDYARGDKPFFSTILTISNHPPYAIPKDIPFKAHSGQEVDRSVEYADWALQQFFSKASKKPWFNNTVFVLVADHGRWVGENRYEFARSFVKIPLIIYGAKLDSGCHAVDNFGGQVDVLTTVMGLLRIPYSNNTFGKDLLREQKSFSFFCSDDKLGCIDSSWFYFSKIKNDEFLVKYRNGDLKNYLNDEPAAAKQMREELLSIYQTDQWMVQNGKTALKK